MKIPTFDEMIIDRTLTATIRIPREYKFRVVVARFLIRLAGKILGCTIKMALEPIDRDSTG